MAANGRSEQREQREQRELLGQWSQTTRKTFELFQELGEINASFFGRFSRPGRSTTGACWTPSRRS